jgi:hypothetical protein
MVLSLSQPFYPRYFSSDLTKYIGFPQGDSGILSQKHYPVLSLQLTSTLQLVSVGGISKLYHTYSLQGKEDVVSIAEYANCNFKRLNALSLCVSNVLNLRIMSCVIKEAQRLKKESEKWKARSVVLSNSIAAELSIDITKKVNLMIKHARLPRKSL